MRHIIPISGKDSCAAALVQMARQPDLPYELFFNDVEMELPETYQWLDKVEKKLNRKIHRVGKSLEQIIYGKGILPSPNVRFCTRKGKIEPMEEWIGEDEATIYFGIRADENRIGYKDGKKNIRPAYPLVELGITLPMVYAVLHKQGLMPPKFYWHRLHDLVSARLEKKHKAGWFRLSPPASIVYASMMEWDFDQAFAWRSRSNCFMCFFQRRYEWAGLLEHHPDLFARAEEIENRVGNNEQQKPFTWIQGYPLASIRRDKEAILMRRAIAVSQHLLKRLPRKQSLREGPLDLLQVTSCGLFCGK